CLRLPQPSATREELREATRWVNDSDVYKIIDEKLQDFTMRKHRTGIDDDDLQVIFDLRKIGRAHVAPIAFCNAFAVEEEKEDGTRRRPIFEPLINDILAEETPPRFSTTTR